MVKSISTSEARANLGDVVNSVYYTKEPVKFEKRGKVLAVLISLDDFERYQQARLTRAWATLERVQERNAHLDPDEVLAVVTEEVKAVRAERSTQRPADAESGR